MSTVETPPVVGVGIACYVETSGGLGTFKTIFAEYISAHELKMNFHKNWRRSEKAAFTKYCKKWQDDRDKK